MNRYTITKDVEIIDNDAIIDVDPAYITECQISFLNEGNSVSIGDNIYFKRDGQIVWEGKVSKIEPLSETETRINIIKK